MPKFVRFETEAYEHAPAAFYLSFGPKTSRRARPTNRRAIKVLLEVRTLSLSLSRERERESEADRVSPIWSRSTFFIFGTSRLWTFAGVAESDTESCSTG